MIVEQTQRRRAADKHAVILHGGEAAQVKPAPQVAELDSRGTTHGLGTRDSAGGTSASPSLREKAKRAHSVFEFIAANQFTRREGKGSGVRELARLWYRVREREAKVRRGVASTNKICVLPREKT